MSCVIEVLDAGSNYRFNSNEQKRQFINQISNNNKIKFFLKFRMEITLGSKKFLGRCSTNKLTIAVSFYLALFPKIDFSDVNDTIDTFFRFPFESFLGIGG